MIKLIRLALSFVLVIFVWIHAHWSVASSITLIFIGIETINIHLLGQLRAERSDRTKTEYRLWSKMKKHKRLIETISKKTEYVRNQFNTTKSKSSVSVHNPTDSDGKGDRG